MTHTKDALKARKPEMVRVPNETNAKKAKALAPAENVVGNGKDNRSANAVAVPKPNGFDLNKFKSKRADTIANVATLQTGLAEHCDPFPRPPMAGCWTEVYTVHFSADA